MKIKILFFAAARERLGVSESWIELPDRSTLKDLQDRLLADHPDVRSLLKICRFSVNSEYATPDDSPAEGAEVGVIPPVSGGDGRPTPDDEIHSQIVRRSIDIAALILKVSSPSCGAALTFAGTVRADLDAGRAVVQITYEGYETMAESALRAIAGRAAKKYGVKVAVEHRLGILRIGEISIGIAVASPHRSDGFSALRDIIEDVKRDMPIWKKEEFSDGASEWVNCRHGDTPPHQTDERH